MTKNIDNSLFLLSFPIFNYLLLSYGWICNLECNVFTKYFPQMSKRKNSNWRTTNANVWSVYLKSWTSSSTKNFRSPSTSASSTSSSLSSTTSERLTASTRPSQDGKAHSTFFHKFSIFHFYKITSREGTGKGQWVREHTNNAFHIATDPLTLHPTFMYLLTC